MILYRMSKIRHAEDLSGKGAELSGGRWNAAGVPALYLAENVSLAILETIVHCHYIGDLHNRLLLSVDVPEASTQTIDRDALPEDWNSIPWHGFTIERGTSWLRSGESLLLKVPSAIVPQENIFIVNPGHPGHKKVKIIRREIFRPDNRLALL
jgi:RES domain-containing protein